MIWPLFLFLCLISTIRFLILIVYTLKIKKIDFTFNARKFSLLKTVPSFSSLTVRGFKSLPTVIGFNRAYDLLNFFYTLDGNRQKKLRALKSLIPVYIIGVSLNFLYVVNETSLVMHDYFFFTKPKSIYWYVTWDLKFQINHLLFFIFCENDELAKTRKIRRDPLFFNPGPSKLVSRNVFSSKKITSSEAPQLVEILVGKNTPTTHLAINNSGGESNTSGDFSMFTTHHLQDRKFIYTPGIGSSKLYTNVFYTPELVKPYSNTVQQIARNTGAINNSMCRNLIAQTNFVRQMDLESRVFLVTSNQSTQKNLTLVYNNRYYTQNLLQMYDENRILYANRSQIEIWKILTATYSEMSKLEKDMLLNIVKLFKFESKIKYEYAKFINLDKDKIILAKKNELNYTSTKLTLIRDYGSKIHNHKDVKVFLLLAAETFEREKIITVSNDLSPDLFF
jgi:hypothetical protein